MLIPKVIFRLWIGLRTSHAKLSSALPWPIETGFSRSKSIWLSLRNFIFMKKRRSIFSDPPEADGQKYLGNIWGWKFSWISLAIILFFLGLMLARYAYMKSTGEWEQRTEKIEREK